MSGLQFYETGPKRDDRPRARMAGRAGGGGGGRAAAFAFGPLVRHGNSSNREKCSINNAPQLLPPKHAFP